MKKYAIFGGSFDPPHICHQKIVKLCLEELGVCRVFIVPTFLSPFKRSFSAPPQMRYKWLCRVFAPFFPNVEVLDNEIRKHKSVYTIETVEELSAKLGKQSYDKIYLIIGSDNLKDFAKWHRYEELISLVEPVVVSRDGVSSDKFKTLALDCDASSSDFRVGFDEEMIPICIRDEVVNFYKGKV